MNKLCVLLCTAISLTLCGCASEQDENEGSSQAEDFAARINGTQTQAASEQTATGPTPEQGQTQLQQQQGSEGPEAAFAAGTATDPNSSCSANLFSQFIGQKPNAEVRSQIMLKAEGISEVRFIAPGANYIKPDPTHPRLNVMIAVDGIIRDIRCG